MIGIYKITNKINNKSYIGQSIDIELRIAQHKEAILTSKASWYPEARLESNSLEDFTFEVLQICSQKELNELEEYWIKKYNTYENGYNRTANGQCYLKNNFKIFIKKQKELTIKQICEAMKKMNGNAFKLWLYFYYKKNSSEEYIIFSPAIIRNEIGLSENGPRAALNDLIKLNYCQQKENNYYIYYN